MDDPDDDGQRRFSTGGERRWAVWLCRPETLQALVSIGRFIVDVIRQFWN